MPNPRDEKGWRVPRQGTRLENVYRLMQLGNGATKIQAAIGGNLGTIRAQMWQIRHPDISNQKALNYERQKAGQQQGNDL